MFILTLWIDIFILLFEIMLMPSIWLKRGCAYSILEKVSRVKSQPRAFSLVEGASLQQILERNTIHASECKTTVECIRQSLHASTCIQRDA